MLRRGSPRGNLSYSWKGDNIKLGGLHWWVRKQLPIPKLCQVCRKVPPYDLANVTGVYSRDISNWKYLCRRCHMNSDGRMKNLMQYKENRQWSADELSILSNRYGYMSKDILMELLPNRTWTAIKLKAERLGFIRK